MSDALQNVLDRLKGVKQTGEGKWMALCPAHEDTDPSLSIKLGDDGKILLHCFAGDEPAAIVEAIGLGMSDLFADSGNGSGGQRRATLKLKTQARSEKKPKPGIDWSKYDLVESYFYHDTASKLLFKVQRMVNRETGDKQFPVYQPNGKGGWIRGIKGHVDPLPYRLPMVLDAVERGNTIYIAEGEKDVHTLESLKLTATCNPGGAGNWGAAYSEHLKGANVVIFADNDKPGRAHAQDVAAKTYGLAASIKVVGFPDLPQKGDVSDWLNAGHTREELLALVDATPEWTPEDAAEEEPEEAVNPFAGNIFSVGEWLSRSNDCEWIIEPLLRRGELGFNYGPPKVGKSFVMLDALFAVTLGKQWCGGRYTVGKPRNVLLAIGEGQHGLKARLEAAAINWSTTPGELADRFRVVPMVPNLYHAAPDHHRSSERFVEAIEDTDLKPDLLVIDTYSRAILGAEENSNRDAALILDTLQRVQSRLECAVLVVHHSSKGAGELRGASAVLGGADVVLKCSPEGTVRRMEIEFAKDIPEQKPVTFDLFPAGDTGSCYVVWGDESEDATLDDRIVDFLKSEHPQSFTARELAEALDCQQNTVMGRLWKLKNFYLVDYALRSTDRPKSNANPYMWRCLETPSPKEGHE